MSAARDLANFLTRITVVTANARPGGDADRQYGRQRGDGRLARIRRDSSVTWRGSFGWIVLQLSPMLSSRRTGSVYIAANARITRCIGHFLPAFRAATPADFISPLNANQRRANPHDNDTSRGVTGLRRRGPERDKRLCPVFRRSRRGMAFFASGAPREGREIGR